MADQGKWFKLWNSAIEDADLENLELEDWARWAKLGAYIKAHGKEGRVRFPYPYRKLLGMFRVPTIEAAKVVLNRFPNVHVGERNVTVSPETNTTVSLEIEFQNWHQYQGDLSSTRVRNFRVRKRLRETIQEERRGDKKREEENKNKSRAFAKPTLAELMDFIKTENLKLDPQRFLNHYEANGWKVGRNAMKDWKATARNWKQEELFNVNPSKPANAFVATGKESAKYDHLSK